MNAFRSVQHLFFIWISSVAQFALRFAERFRTVSEVLIIENEDGSLTLRMTGHFKSIRLGDRRLEKIEQLEPEALPPDWRSILRACQVQFVLRPSKFLIRRLELPKQANEFLDGIIRAQIDRITPWSAGDAVYGWTPATATAQERLHLNVVATTRQIMAPYLHLGQMLGAEFVSIATFVVGADGPIPVKVLELRSLRPAEIQRVRSIMSWLFLSVGAFAAVALLFAVIVGGTLDSERQEISRRIAERRSAPNVVQKNAGYASVVARRKRETPSSVMVLEELSRILPDHTSVTELRIEKDRLQLIGVTQDAPSLVRLMEQSPQFARATFFAPTTRSSGEKVERFHIEALLKPYFELGL